MTAHTVNAVIRLRIYPNQAQEGQLKQFCGAARWVYNWALQRWKQRFDEGLRTTAYDLANELVFLKKMDATAWLKDVQAAGLQQALLHAEQAYKRFFKGKARYPKFKKRGQRDSFSFPQYTVHDAVGQKLLLSKIGSIRCARQQFSGLVRTATVVREGDGWYACIRTQREVTKIAQGTTAVGIDMGVAKMATTCTIEGVSLHFAHHPSLDKLIKRINILNEQLSRKRYANKRGSCNWEKTRLKVAKAHAKLTNARRDHLHKVSTALVRRYGTIVVEDLKIKNMSRSAVGTVEHPNCNSSAKKGLNRSIRKQAWGYFFQLLEYKCKWYGRTFLKVDPKNTSRTCPTCNHVAKDNRKSQAVFQCVACGHTANADQVGALNVLRRGLQALPAV